MGATVTEQLRTFQGELFRLDTHLDRLLNSLAVCSIDPGCSRRELVEVADRVIAHNYPLLADGDDLGMGIFVTPGAYPAFAGGVESVPMKHRNVGTARRCARHELSAADREAIAEHFEEDRKLFEYVADRVADGALRGN